MLNTNNNLQTQTSNALYNIIMEVGGKDRPLMLATSNYNLPYKFKSAERTIQVAEGSLESTTKVYMDNSKIVSHDIRNQFYAKAKAVQIILIGIDNDIYSIVDACPNACEMWKAIERLKQGESINVQDLETNIPQQAATRNRGKAIVNSPLSAYDQEPAMVTKIDEMSKEKEINKLMTLISLSFKKIYKPTNNNLRTSSNTNRENQDNTPKINSVTGDDTNDEPEDQELEAHYLYMEKIQEVTPGMSNNGEEADQDNDDDVARERDLLASLIEKLKCEIDDSKNLNKLLESSNQTLVDKLKSEIEDFENKNKCLESSNNHFKEAKTKLAKNNQLMFKHLKKFQAELDRYHDANYASKVEIKCVKAKRELISYKMSSENSFNEYTKKINDLNQTISEMKKELIAHQETISIISKEKEAQNKFYKTCEDKEIEKVIALENKVMVFDDIVYKTAQSVQTINMLNRCYNDNLALMLAPESDERICRTKLKEMVDDLRYFNSLEHEVDSLKSQLETQRTQFSNEIDRLSKEYYYADHMNAILGTVKFGNDQIALILGYGDLFDIVTSLPKLKFFKDHLCSFCELGKAKQKSFNTKTTPSSKRRLQLLLMDLCGPMRVESINGKKYVQVIIDDYSRYTWTHFLRSKDETPEVLFDFLKLVKEDYKLKLEQFEQTKARNF
ncbi:integrase, catalytic region, zinc finger, CCHC-type containing protein [Tanacetum coccineum]|uniref:Integrase, catalytic region, zinc finger, CCHC-type containing protein n=1 Tax=Tanacetum coccineum TaxID=301880 RepID=A0ABQ5GHT4_9ASTR